MFVSPLSVLDTNGYSLRTPPQVRIPLPDLRDRCKAILPSGLEGFLPVRINPPPPPFSSFTPFLPGFFLSPRRKDLRSLFFPDFGNYVAVSGMCFLSPQLSIILFFPSLQIEGFFFSFPSFLQRTFACFRRAPFGSFLKQQVFPCFFLFLEPEVLLSCEDSIFFPSLLSNLLLPLLPSSAPS